MAYRKILKIWVNRYRRSKKPIVGPRARVDASKGRPFRANTRIDMPLGILPMLAGTPH